MCGPVEAAIRIAVGVFADIKEVSFAPVRVALRGVLSQLSAHVQ
jgi:hypothetical protein